MTLWVVRCAAAAGSPPPPLPPPGTVLRGTMVVGEARDRDSQQRVPLSLSLLADRSGVGVGGGSLSGRHLGHPAPSPLLGLHEERLEEAAEEEGGGGGQPAAPPRHELALALPSPHHSPRHFSPSPLRPHPAATAASAAAFAGGQAALLAAQQPPCGSGTRSAASSPPALHRGAAEAAAHARALAMAAAAHESRAAEEKAVNSVSSHLQL